MPNNDPILAHIQNAQDLATRLNGVLCAIDHLDNDSACAEGVTALIRVARDMSSVLQRDLDAVNLPKPCSPA